MFRKALMTLGVMMLVAGPTVAAESVEKSPPPAPYKKVSELVKLPDFLPGMDSLCRPHDVAGRAVSRLRPCGQVGQHNLYDPP